MSSAEGQWLEAVDPEILRRRRERIVLLLGAVVVLFLAVTLAYYNRPRPAPPDEMLHAVQYAIRHTILVRGTLFFNSAVDAQVVHLDDNRFEVRGWVQDVNADGFSWTYLYDAKVEPRQSDYNVYDVTVVPQF
jgi:hypothetical protein